MPSLIERLNELIDLSPDQIVAAIVDPIQTPVSMVTLGVAGLRAIEGRQVHFLEWSEYAHRVNNDSGAEGEVFANDGVYTAWASSPDSDAGNKWHIVSHEGFLKLDLDTYRFP